LKNKHEAKWKGHVCEGAGCPEKDSSWQEYDKFRAYLQAANQYGLTSEFKNDTGFGEGFYSQETGVDPFGTAWSDPEEYAWCGSAGNGSFHELAGNVYECYRQCQWHAHKNKDGAALADCVKNLTFAQKQYEWRHKPGCVPNVTIDASNGMGLDEVGYPYGHANASADAAASCLELVPVRTMYDYGYSVATGNFSMEDLEEAMQVCVCIIYVCIYILYICMYIYICTHTHTAGGYAERRCDKGIPGGESFQ